MKFIALWVNDNDSIEVRRGRVDCAGTNLRLGRTHYFGMDFRYKAPRKQAATKVRHYITTSTTNSHVLLLGNQDPSGLLYRKLLEAIQFKTLNDLYVFEARDIEHLSQKFARKLSNNHSLLGV